MSLEQGRALVQGVMILMSAAVAYWISLPIGLAMVALVGIVRLQESATDWCPSDLLLRPMGLRKKGEAAP